MSTIEPKMLYPVGYTPAFEEKGEDGKLLHPFVGPLSRYPLVDFREQDMTKIVGGFAGKEYLFAQFRVHPPIQVAPDANINEVAAVLMVATPKPLHWASIHVVFALREIHVPDGKPEEERQFEEFTPLIVKEAYQGKYDPNFLYFVVQNVKYPKAGRFRAEARIVVTRGEKTPQLTGDLAPEWRGQEEPGELQEEHLAGVAVSKSVTEVKEGVILD